MVALGDSKSCTQLGGHPNVELPGLMIIIIIIFFYDNHNDRGNFEIDFEFNDDHVLGVVIILEEHHNVELQKHAD